MVLWAELCSTIRELPYAYIPQTHARAMDAVFLVSNYSFYNGVYSTINQAVHFAQRHHTRQLYLSHLQQPVGQKSAKTEPGVEFPVTHKQSVTSSHSIWSS